MTDTTEPSAYAYTAPVSYGPDVPVLDVHLAQGIPPGRVARTVEMKNAIVLCDLDADGRVLGLEILDPFPPGAEIATAEERPGPCPS